MEAPAAALGGRVVAFIDIGTNAIRLLVVRVVPGHLHTVVTEQREPARLGEGEFPDRRLQPAAHGAGRARVPEIRRIGPLSRGRRDRRRGHLGDAERPSTRRSSSTGCERRRASTSA